MLSWGHVKAIANPLSIRLVPCDERGKARFFGVKKNGEVAESRLLAHELDVTNSSSDHNTIIQNNIQQFMLC